MRIIGCDLHARQQTVAMLNVETGEIGEKILRHEGDAVRRNNKTPAEVFDSAGACEACEAVRILRVYFPELECPSFSKKSNKSLMAGLFLGT